MTRQGIFSCLCAALLAAPVQACRGPDTSFKISTLAYSDVVVEGLVTEVIGELREFVRVHVETEETWHGPDRPYWVFYVSWYGQETGWPPDPGSHVVVAAAYSTSGHWMAQPSRRDEPVPPGPIVFGGPCGELLIFEIDESSETEAEHMQIDEETWRGDNRHLVRLKEIGHSPLFHKWPRDRLVALFRRVMGRKLTID